MSFSRQSDPLVSLADDYGWNNGGNVIYGMVNCSVIMIIILDSFILIHQNQLVEHFVLQFAQKKWGGSQRRVFFRSQDQ